ncbi:CRAL TRIO domain containing protein [Asbolus verrucosus]|uniref:CRAL TRIO domain containing protein n=1 Tax=Asbolus verrucosus TaxID=1661398 RepID=A0A482W0Z6_ASBVE|nr:CRAL TRIO domain containing protein [Asbolus verrucosus]
MPAENEIVAELDLGEPSQELLDWAKENIREDPNTKCQLLSDFKDMIYSRGECIPIRSDDAFLLRFLRSRKFSLEAAYNLFINYHNFREDNPTFVESVGFECLEIAGGYDVINVPPYLDQAGRRILLYKISKWDPDNYSIDDAFKATLMILELAMLEERAQIKGGICIVDCSGISTQQVLYCTPSIARKLVQISVVSFSIV